MNKAIPQATVISPARRDAVGGPTMRAAVIDRYGPPRNLHMGEVKRPACGAWQALVRVRAAGVNPIDWRIRSGSLRMLLFPRFPLVLGVDIAGEIVEVGATARKEGWRVGDEVFCFLDSKHGGGYAEYALAGADILARKPHNLSFEEAAAVPLAAMTALHALRDVGKAGPGKEVLINGASGGVGTFAVQLGKILGARVTGMCGESHLGFVHDLGADRVINYEREDFTRRQEKYDVVFDVVAKSSFWKCRRILKRRGHYITTVPSARSVMTEGLTMLLGRRCHNILTRPDGKDLQYLAGLIEDGRLRPVVQEVYPLEEAATAHRVSEEGHVRGKLVLAVE
jgi:NADPH:quinone reductase-like Zn-dependent oxidoreductase